MTEQEILNLEGIVIRKLPTVVVSRWRHYVQLHGEPKTNDNVIEGPDEKGLYVVEEHKPVSAELAGKFMITFVHGTGTTVQFVKKRDGIGNTIVEAYEDYMK